MSKVLFEVDLSKFRYYKVDIICDYLMEFFAKEMIDYISASNNQVSKDVVDYHVGIYSLSEFMDECTPVEKKRLLYKMLLERMYPIIVNSKILFVAELDCFRPGYIANVDAGEFTEDLYQYLCDLVVSAQRSVTVHSMRVNRQILVEVRVLASMSEYTKMGIRELSDSELAISAITEPVLTV